MQADSNALRLLPDPGPEPELQDAHTDGSCAAPGAVGGWTGILVSERAVASGSGATPGSSTHNAAELTAAIERLAYLVASGVREVELVSDSRYLVSGMSFNGRTGWAHAAAEREWRTTRGKPSPIVTSGNR